MKKRLIAVAVLLAAGSLFGCQKSDKTKDETTNNSKATEAEISYKDGEYQGKSEIDEWGGYVTTTIVVKDGKIESATLENYDKDEKIKDETYGMEDGVIKNEGLYKIQQNAVEGAKEYPSKLIEKQDVEKIDVIAGATVSLKSYKEAVNAALKDAEK